MGVEVRTKDKLFVAVAAPLAAAAAYFFLWRVDAAKDLAELERRNDALVAEEDFPVAMRRAERQLADSAADLAAERAAPAPDAKMKADGGATSAERESAVLDVFRESGLVVVRGEARDGTTADGGPGAVIGEAAGIDGGWRAVCRRYTLDGTYPAVKRALDAFAARRMAVVAEKAEMRESGRGRWTLEVWL